MIKYNCRTGRGDALDYTARMKRDVIYKKALSGLRCKTCGPGNDTTIRFVQHKGYAGSGSVDPIIEACCPKFHQEIEDRLSSYAP